MKTTRRTSWHLLLMVLSVLIMGGCGPKRTVFLDTAADFSVIRRVAVLPFENLTGDPNAAEKIRHIFVIELLSLRIVEVVDPGEVARVLADERIDDVSLLGPGQITALADILGADAVILGSVEDFGVDRGGAVSSPQVSVTCRMVEVEGGALVWSAAASRSGAGAGARLFGVQGDSATEAARKMVHDVLKTLVK